MTGKGSGYGMMSSRNCIILSLALVLCAAGALFLLDWYGRNARIYGVTGGIDTPGVEKRLVESPLEAYRFWRSRGFRGRTILFVADKWERLDRDDVLVDPPPSRTYPLKLFKIADHMERDRLNERNFLFVAAVNGITRRIVAILSPGGFDEMKEMARTARNSRIARGEIYMTHQGFPRWYTTADAFKGEQEPVLLYVDASYFRDIEPEELFRYLTAAKLRTDSVILCRGRKSDRSTEQESGRLVRFARLLGITVDTTASAQPTPVSKTQP